MVIIPGAKKSLAQRFYANIIDYLLFYAFMAIYIYVFGDPLESGGWKVTGVAYAGVFVVWVVYFPVLECVRGQTLGKQLLHLHVVDLQGNLPMIHQAVLRRLFDMFDFMTLGIAAMLFINFSAKNQRLGDMIAGTTVVCTEGECRHCGATLELTPKEVAKNIFVCPQCQGVN